MPGLDQPLLLATDLDRTLLPNGAQPESANARPRFHRFVDAPQVILAYVTGRHRELVEQAMGDFDLPEPNYVIGDVGTSIYQVLGHDWVQLEAWQSFIDADWAGCSHDHLAAKLVGIDGLRLQEPEKQGRFKLSYYTPPLADPSALIGLARCRLADTGAHCNLVWSLDETTDTGLLDILPSSASKLHALEFLRAHLEIPLERTVFAGDSGNDMEVLESEIPSVLVANATNSVRAEAMERAKANGNLEQLYLAQGNGADMNGNYSAGILEGVAHFVPELQTMLEG